MIAGQWAAVIPEQLPALGLAIPRSARGTNPSFPICPAYDAHGALCFAHEGFQPWAPYDPKLAAFITAVSLPHVRFGVFVWVIIRFS
jgi:hypothetical protein